MADQQPKGSLADAESILTIIGLLLGTGGGLKLFTLLFNNIWDRWKKKDEYENLRTQEFQVVAWQKLQEEEKLTEILRGELSNAREQLATANTQIALKGLEIIHLTNENTRLRAILDKLNKGWRQNHPDIT